MIWALRYLLHDGDLTNDQIGLANDDLRSLAERLRSCRSGIVYFGLGPGEYTANEMLERKEVDACLFVGSEGIAQLSQAATQRVEQIPTIVLDNPGAGCLVTPAVQFTTAVYGVNTHGTAYRMDDVPILWKAILPSPYPTDHQVLARLARNF